LFSTQNSPNEARRNRVTRLWQQVTFDLIGPLPRTKRVTFGS